MKRSFTIAGILILLSVLSATSMAQKLDMEKLSAMRPRSIGPAGMSEIGRASCRERV